MGHLKSTRRGSQAKINVVSIYSDDSVSLKASCIKETTRRPKGFLKRGDTTPVTPVLVGGGPTRFFSFVFTH